VLTGCAQPNQYQPPPPPSVNVAKPVVQTVTNYLEETGSSEPTERVEIRARVKGFLEKVSFQDGQDVKKGDQLYLIQQSEYENALAMAAANVEAAQVEIDRAKIELDRQEKLLKNNATPETQVVQTRSEYNHALAAHKAAVATRDQAQLNLDYCNVTTPIEGRVERTIVKLGNLVGDDGATHLTTVVSYNPIHVYFNISERALLEAAKKRSRQSSKTDITGIKAYLRRALDDGFPFEGHLDYADLGVDQSTGTFTIRAVFPNPNLEILPGLFVRVRIPLGTTHNAVLLPERSIGFDQVGRFVMIVGDGNIVERRNIELGAKYGDMVVIASGLSGTETVVIDGIQRARPGGEVTPKETQLARVEGSIETVEEGKHPMVDGDTPSAEVGDATSESDAAVGDPFPVNDSAESTTSSG
jgi:RND family efflux transporter MFP subunit